MKLNNSGMCTCFVHSGIVDSHGLMQALLADIEQAGGVLAVASQVVRGIAEGPGQRLVQQAPRGAGNTASCSSSGDKSGSTGMGGRSEAVSSSGDGILLEVKDLQSDTTSWLRAKQVVNCGGLRAQHISSLIQGIPSASIPKQFLAKGEPWPGTQSAETACAWTACGEQECRWEDKITAATHTHTHIHTWQCISIYMMYIYDIYMCISIYMIYIYASCILGKEAPSMCLFMAWVWLSV